MEILTLMILRTSCIFLPKKHEDIGVLYNNLVAGEGKVDIDRACQWAGAAKDDVMNKNTEFHTDGDKDCHVTM